MVEQIAGAGQGSQALEPLDGVSGWTRFGSWLLERVLTIVALGVGWIIWAIALRGGQVKHPQKNDEPNDLGPRD